MRRSRAFLLVLALVAGCGSSGTTSITSAPGGSASGTDRYVTAALGSHRYHVVHENLGTCEGAAEDGDETLVLTLTADGLSMENVDYKWTHQFQRIGDDTFRREETSETGHTWLVTLTFGDTGFVAESVTDEPEAQGSEVPEPRLCLRYTYTLAD